MKLTTTRRFAALAATALAAGVLVSGPVQGATGLIDYSCTVTGDYKFTFTFDQDTNATAPLYVGKSYAHTYTARTTFPEGGVNLARFFGVTSFDGAIDATVLRNGSPVAVNAPIPRTAVPKSGTPLVLVANGALPAVKVAAPGTVTYKPSDLKFTVNAYRADGSTVFSLDKGNCDMAAAGESKVLDTLTFVKSPSKTTTSAAYGKAAKKVAASARVTSTSGVAPTGKVTFALVKGSKKIKSVTANVVGGKAAASFAGVKAKGAYKVVSTYSGSTAVNGSSSTKSFTIK